VDTVALRHVHLAARQLAPTGQIYAGMVGDGLPFGYVLRRHHGCRAGPRPTRRLRQYCLGVRLDRDRRLGCYVRQHLITLRGRL
jgi:hypothetical protein